MTAEADGNFGTAGLLKAGEGKGGSSPAGFRGSMGLLNCGLGPMASRTRRGDVSALSCPVCGALLYTLQISVQSKWSP